MFRIHAILVGLALWILGCKKESVAPIATPEAKALAIGLVTDVGGRGDQSFNDSALRGLEVWAAGVEYQGGSYKPLDDARRSASIPSVLSDRLKRLSIRPMVVQSKAQEDYLPNLQLLVDQGVALAIATGFMLENAVEAIAKANRNSKFLLIDSPLLDAKGAIVTLPNVRTVVFKEEEGSFLAGALAAMVAPNKVGFVGGMEIPLIQKFEVGFRAGVKTVNPNTKVLVQYTGSFDNISAGKQIASDLISKGTQVIFHAAGSDGTGVIAAVKEARAAGKNVYAIGVDSDQSHLAPEAVLTSMIKRVDLMVYETIASVDQNSFTPGDRSVGLKEGAVELAEIKIDIDHKEAILKRLDELKAQIVDGRIRVPADRSAFDRFNPPAK